jgi:hypothetical protein
MSKVPPLLRNLHIAAAIIHLISCVLSVIVHTDTIVGKITLPHHTYMADPTATIKGLIVNETTTHEPILYTNPMTWIAANEGFTFFSHLLALFLMPRANNLSDFERTRRTLEYALTAGILQVALVLGIGSVAIYDVMMLLLLNVAIQLLGWLWDKTNDEFIKPYLLGIAFGLLSVEIIYVIGQSLNLNGIEPGGYIVMGVFYAIFYILFGVVKFFKSWRNHENELYILMSVSSKVALSWILIGNTYQGLRELEVDSAPLDHTDLDWGAVQYLVTFVCGLVLIIGIPIIINLPVNVEMGTGSIEEEMNNYSYRRSRRNFKTINF